MFPISRIRLGHIDVIRHPRCGPRASMLIPASLEPAYMFREGSRFGRPSFAASKKLYVLRACTYATQILISRLERIDFRRSEEHTSELQSLMRISYDVFCLKKKKI